MRDFPITTEVMLQRLQKPLTLSKAIQMTFTLPLRQLHFQRNHSEVNTSVLRLLPSPAEQLPSQRKRQCSPKGIAMFLQRLLRF